MNLKMIPAFVDSWDGKTLRVFIEGYTDGSDVGMKAEVCYSFSDRPDYTGFHIEKGDAVWVMFNGGDTNSPIVMGFRNMNTGENKDSRRFRHINIEHHASQNMVQTSSQHNISVEQALTVLAQAFNLTGDSTFTGSFTINGDLTVSGNISNGGNISSAGSITDSDGNNGA